MRDIKFRGKSSRFGMVHGSLLIDDPQHAVYIVNNESGSIYDVDPETVGQYTGLKDCNGKEIYEGDIVQYTDSFGIRYGVVEWDSFTRIEWIIRFSSTAIHGDHHMFESSEVIGNVYENQELLETEG